MDLKEYQDKFDNVDPNIFWRLGCGEHLNLLDEALERIAELEQENERLRKTDSAYKKYWLERAAEIAEKYKGRYYDAVAAIRAEIEK